MLLPLPPGARVGVFAPSGVFERDRLDRGVELIESWGYRAVPAPGLGLRHRYLAGPDEARLADLRWALGDPSLDAAWMARGGYGLARLLGRLDWDGLPERPVVGFSDGTALLSALWGRGRAGIHGPVLHSLADHADDASRQRVRELLAGRSSFRWQGRSLAGGRAAGPLVGGNLCVLASLCGTPWQLDARGAVLLVEDVGERPYRVDRLLWQLRAAGVLDGVRALLLGSFVDCGGAEALGHVAQELLLDLGVPVVAGLPVGHGPRNHAFVHGWPVRVEDGVVEADGPPPG